MPFRAFSTKVVGTGAAALKVAFAGSSTPEKYFTENTGYTDNPLVTKTTNGLSFAPLGGIGTGGQALGNQLVTSLQRPVRFLASGVGGTTLTQWEASPSTYRAALVAGITAMGGVDYCVAQVGWNDANGQTVASQASHEAKLRSFYSKIRSETGLPNLPIVMGGTQKNSGTGNAPTQTVWVRAAEYNVSTDANNYLACPTFDLEQLPDLTHQTAAAYAISAPRFGECIIGLVTGNGVKAPPRITAATPISYTITDITIAHGSGNDYTPSTALTGWLVSSDGGTTYAAPTSAVKRDRVTIRLTHASNGGNAQLIKYMNDGAPVTTGAVLDNTSPQTYPLLPTASPISMIAPPSNPGPPVNTTAPAAPTSTANRAGQTFTGSTGAWTGSPTFTYQWYRDNSSTPISGATAATYLAAPADVGHTLICAVIGTGTAGSTTAYSAATATVLAGLFAVDSAFAGTAGALLVGTTDDNGNVWAGLAGDPAFDGTGGLFASTATGFTSTDPFVPTTNEYDVRGTMSVLSVNTAGTWSLQARLTDVNNRMFAGYLSTAPTPGWAIGSAIAGTPAYYVSNAFTPTAGSSYEMLFEVRNDRKTLYAGPIGGTLLKVAEVFTADVAASNAITAKGIAGIRLTGTTTVTSTTGPHWRSFRVSDPGV